MPQSLAGQATTATRAGPGVNVTFLELVQKGFIQFCYKFKNVAERVEVFGGLDLFVTFWGNAKKLINKTFQYQPIPPFPTKAY